MASSTTNGSSCTRCVFFEDHHGNTGAITGDAGLCRYNPPISQPDPNSRGLWPIVSSSDWCGHFTTPHQPGPMAAE